MKSKIILVNLIVLFGYLALLSLYSRLSMNSGDASASVLIGAMTFITIQIIVNILIALMMFFTSKPEAGKQFLLAAFLVGLIGFPACWGSAWVVSGGKPLVL